MDIRTDRSNEKRRPSAADASLAQFVADVQYYLTQTPRQLPSRYFYDELGSALFEAICRLPWYRITRSEHALLAAHGDAILRHLDPLSAIVELGSGSGEKLKTILEAGGRRAGGLDVHLVDLSASALELSSRVLAPLDGVRASAHRLSYEEGLREATRAISGSGRTLVLFLGSNIGNFDPPAADAFMRGLRGTLAGGDLLLVGADLVKPERELLLAYDDPLGVTAAFNRNLLVRINRELAADFAVERFAHRAVWNAAESRVEMHLVARSAQQVHVGAAQLDLRFDEGEAIWTESSYKYEPEQIARMIEATGFRTTSQWLDPADRFALTLAEAV
ncbi:MAG: dimethylhistidine N-methyltransferase [Acidobacteria bacterium RIFCSPLOWO2_02_FULL_67_36]|nr:MAG: dimethylhistidine N-methyltransferase [Acidobacteria bacterium RIFCSPLOWO2_02_FULL_67_36]OFW21935.1 MAG: dimethylhistidine N-methyltransferase [Acidobacteria bacterium RIFCSPLOWO2_12_FULL_66_21]